MSKFDSKVNRSGEDEKEPKISESSLIKVHDTQTNFNPDLKENLSNIAINQKERFLRVLRLFLRDKEPK
jgi:hypothetical protein